MISSTTRNLLSKWTIVLATVAMISGIWAPTIFAASTASYTYTDDKSGIKAEGFSTYVSGDHMVWYDLDSTKQRQIYYKHLKTGEVKQITNYASLKDGPAITVMDNGEVVIIWLDRVDTGISSGMWDIYAYYMDSGERIKLSNLATSIHMGISVSADIVVWYDQLNRDAYYYDLRTRQEELFAKGTKPQVYGRSIAYITDQGDVALYSLDKSASEVLVDLPYHKYPEEIVYNGTHILWKENNLDLKTKYVHYDTSDPYAIPRDLTLPSKKEREYPHLFIGDGHAVWVEWANGSQQLTGFNLEHGETHVISRGEQVLGVLGYDGSRILLQQADGSLVYRTVVRTVQNNNYAPIHNPQNVVEMIGSEGGTISAGEGIIQIVIPAGVFDSYTLVRISTDEQVNIPTDRSIPLGRQYAVTDAWRIGFGSEIAVEDGIQIKFTLDAADWSEEQVRRMSVYQWDGDTKSWLRIGGDTRAADREIRATISQDQPEVTYAVFMNDVSFDDMEGHWAREYVEVLAAKGLIDGMGDRLYSPDGELTRAQFTKMLVGALGLPASEVDSASTTFEDVPIDHWAHQWVEAAAKHGIVQGNNGKFLPNEVLTREQMAVMLVRALGKEVETITNETVMPFTDISEISEWALEHVRVASALGLVEGYDGRFAPKQSSTRAAGATVIYRVLEQMDRL